jgi:hypothetical protein
MRRIRSASPKRPARAAARSGRCPPKRTYATEAPAVRGLCPQISYDKINRRIEISATITEAIADALENAQVLPQEASNVAQRDMAGAGFEPATFGL